MPGTPAPPLLVLDLEKTLIGSEYDARYGWRHVKRPGLDFLIKNLSNYYEIVIFSENDIGAVQELLMAIDPNSACHKLGSSAAEARDGVMIKRLDCLNRELSRIILIDDNPDAFQLFPRNTLQVQPFVDFTDKNDTVLYDLVPLLQAFVHDDSKDFRDTIDDLGTNLAEEAVIEYQMRLSKKKSDENVNRNKGIGGLIRNGFNKSLPNVEPIESRSGILSVSQIVGSTSNNNLDIEVGGASGSSKVVNGTFGDGSGDGIVGVTPIGYVGPKGPIQKKKGALFEWLENSEKEKEENEMRKMEKMNEIYAKRMYEKRAKDEKEAEEKKRKQEEGL